jgi:RNA polymerase sigma-70 factor (ECF subfamily)
MAEDRAWVALDDATFGPMTEPLRRDLLLHCYRFTGSLHDAEDLVQETLLKAWRGRADYRGEAGLRTWLRRIATRACLDALRQRPSYRTLPSAIGHDAAREVLWLEPLPDDILAGAEADPAAAYELRESVSLAFLVALQRLPARQRAVLILRDVLALKASEVADLLDSSVAGVNSLLHRARRTMRARYARPSLARPRDAQTAGLLRRYIQAWEAGDIDTLLATLKADATLEMPPIPAASIGHAAIGAFLADGILDGVPRRWRGVTTEANGGPAIALYERDEDRYRFTGLHLLVVHEEKITTITAFMDAALAGRFHLPAELHA